MMKSIPTACRHFNMIEMLKVEENKKKGGIGVSSKTKTVAEAATTSNATTKPTASGLLAVKAEEKENEKKSGNKSDCGKISSNGRY